MTAALGPYTHGPYSPIAGAILPVVVVLLLLTLGRKASARRWYRGALGVCLLLAVGNYVAFGEFRYDSYMNEWDVAHYYTGTKYARELGYDRQYEALWLADYDTGLCNTASAIRDLRSYSLIPVASVLARAGAIRARFSPQRWRELCADVAWLKVQLPAARWTLLFEDHGHNAPPTWTAAVGVITNLLSIREPIQRWSMLLVDPALLLLALAAVVWAFGFEAAVLFAVLLGTHYFFSWGHLKGSLFRSDFVVFAVFALCALRTGRPIAAGVCAALAACSRAFPIFFLLGPALLLVHSRLLRRPPHGQPEDPPPSAPSPPVLLLSRFLVACAATACVSIGWAVVYFDGATVFSDWLAKMSVHATSHTSWTVGFRTIFNVALDPHRDWIDTDLTAVENATVWGARVLIILPSLYFVRFLSPSAAYAFGFVPMFFLVSPVHYYMMVLSLPLLFFAAAPAGWSRTLGISWLLISGAMGYLLYFGWTPLRHIWLFEGHGLGFGNTLGMTCLISVTAMHMLAHALRMARPPSPHRRAAGSLRAR